LFIAKSLEPQYYIIKKEIKNRTPSVHYNITDKLFKEIILYDLGMKINIINENDKHVSLRNNFIVKVKYILKHHNENYLKLIVQLIIIFKLFTILFYLS
jgi:hypothetical protein